MDKNILVRQPQIRTVFSHEKLRRTTKVKNKRAMGLIRMKATS